MTVKGTVEDVKPGPGQGTHVMLKTSDATLELALGPTWYQTQKKYALAKGDQFRDAKGFPMWAGRGRQ